MLVKLIILIILTGISSALYRAGGQGREKEANPKWMPMWLRHSWCRDWLCPAVFLLAILPIWHPHSLLGWLSILVFYGLSGAALSTYWGQNEKNNYYWHGLGCGLAGFCLITFVPWWILLARCIICTVGMGYCSKIINFDELEEEVRGILFIL